MTWFDYTVIIIAVWSVLLGWWRGFVYEVLSLLGWVAAYAVARWQAVNLAALMPAELGIDAIKVTVAFILLFVATLIVSGIVIWLLSKLIKFTGLGWIDGLFGSLFGMLRGMLLVLMLVLLAGLTDLPKKPFWREAKLSKPLESMALASLVWLPDSVARRVHFGLRK
ncbi:CvpA family protein [Candidatus Nitrotoga arctica]|uniref:Colicin V production protein n=1 Tax=Candidatus Nitrotoga arctica TaxID=453162 RepID=A0ABM8YXD8_9PROT|nr:CvpA family protein [Candidatus Nitrotoga arctica]CAG9932186.1 Colicin V production protein [Candidatus Nitrotoga arctica]